MIDLKRIPGAAKNWICITCALARHFYIVNNNKRSTSSYVTVTLSRTEDKQLATARP